MATIKLVAKAAKMAPHGMTKAKSIALAIPKPIKIPKKIPTSPPIWPMSKVSIKNWIATVDELFVGAKAEEIKQRATNIAAAMMHKAHR